MPEQAERRLLERTTLLNALETVEPALLDSDYDPIYKNFMFSGERVLASNKEIAISAPLSTPGFAGSVPGRTMIDQLRKAKHGRNVSFKSGGGKVAIITGKTEIKLDLVRADNYAFQMPPKPKRSDGKLPEGDEVKPLYTAIENCLLSTSGYAAVPDQLGVTCVPNGHTVTFYATNRNTMARAKLDLPLSVTQRAVLSKAFCQQVLRLQQGATHCQLLVKRDHALFVADDVMLHGYLIEVDNPIDFEDVIQNCLPKNFPNGMAKFDAKGSQRKRLKIAIEMATGISEVKGAETKTRIIASGNTLKLASASQRGEVKDVVELTRHPDVDIRVNPSHLNTLYDRYEEFLLTEKAAILSKGAGAVCLVAVFDED